MATSYTPPVNIPGNVFDYSIPLRPGHLPGILPTTRGYMPIDVHRRPTYAADDNGWRTVHHGRKTGGWQGRKARATAEAVKNLILM